MAPYVEPRRALLARWAALPLLALAAVLGCEFHPDVNPAYGCENCVAPDRCVDNFCVRGMATMAPTEPPPMPDAGDTAGSEAPPARECEPGASEICYEGVTGTDQNPPCRFGRKTCSDDGVLGPCLGQVLPEDETCNNVDEDCDGMIDEQLMRDARICVDGKYVCVAPSMSVPEACDSADNDCDGTSDEGFDLATDPANCGACGKQCAANETCCDGECADTQSAETHCGQCGMQCRRNTTCCGGGCVDTTSDANHCGECGQRCTGSRSCCSGQCVDTQTDRDHCGPFCLNCAEGEACCFGSCADLNSFQHCGSCERMCGDGELCCDQQCTPGTCAQ